MLAKKRGKVKVVVIRTNTVKFRRSDPICKFLQSVCLAFWEQNLYVVCNNIQPRMKRIRKKFLRLTENRFTKFLKIRNQAPYTF
jgi:hypothetical protein